MSTEFVLNAHLVNVSASDQKCRVWLGMNSLESCLERDPSQQKIILNNMRKRMTLAAWAVKFPLASERENVGNTQSHNDNAGMLPFSEDLSFIHASKDMITDSALTSKSFEHMFVTQIRITLRQQLIWNLANHQQKMRPEIIHVCSSECCLQENSIVCNVSFD